MVEEAVILMQNGREYSRGIVPPGTWAEYYCLYCLITRLIVADRSCCPFLQLRQISIRRLTNLHNRPNLGLAKIIRYVKIPSFFSADSLPPSKTKSDS